MMLALGGGVGAYGMYQKRLRDNRAITPAEFHQAQGEHCRRLLESPASYFLERAKPGLKLFRYETCPYCGTVKALLDYLSIPHSVVEVEPMFKSQIKTHGYGRVPQLKFSDGVILIDSEEITNLIGAKLGMKRNADIDHWRTWARQELSRYIVVVLNQSLMDSVRAYNYIDHVPDVPIWSKWLLKAVGGPVMYLVAEYKTKKTLQKEYGLGTADPQATMFSQLDKWVGSFPSGQKFHGGKEPDMADLDVYGILLSTRCSPLWAALQGQTTAAQWMDHMAALLAKNRKELSTDF